MQRYYDHKLVSAYWNTTYWLIEQEISLFIGQKNDSLMDVLIHKSCNSWCIITAWNPKSHPLSKDENNALNIKLADDLEGLNLVFENALGVPGDLSGWEPEESYFIYDISLEQSCMLGKKYRQYAIVYGNIYILPSLIWLDVT